MAEGGRGILDPPCRWSHGSLLNKIFVHSFKFTRLCTFSFLTENRQNHDFEEK